MEDVIELESDAMRDICVCLNDPRITKDWKHLAYYLKIPRDIYKEFSPDKPKSPTNLLFEWIFAKRIDLTVGQLCNALRAIDRKDIVRVLREHFKQHFPPGQH